MKKLRHAAIAVFAFLVVAPSHPSSASPGSTSAPGETPTPAAPRAADLKEQETLPVSKAGRRRLRDPKQRENRTEGAAFLAANRQRAGVVELPSGLQYEVLHPGDGARPEPGDSVLVQYRGRLLDGTPFAGADSSPVTFALDGVIRGWRQALLIMPAGSKWRLHVPDHLAYGGRGMGRRVGPNATLIFDLELLAVVQGRDTPPSGQGEQAGVADIRVSFRLDPRLTRSLYMGDRWVSPSSSPYLRVGDADGVTVEARAIGVDALQRPVPAGIEWLAGDAELVAVTPARGSAVTIRVRREGQTELRVRAGARVRSLPLTATRANGVIQVEVGGGGASRIAK